jgi:hypothetical protein
MVAFVTQTDLESTIVNDPEFIKGTLWGKPRNGHPEGMVFYHIKEVLGNVKLHYESDKDFSKLRLIALIHDTFKYKVDTSKPRHGDNHHAMYARIFAEKYITDVDILDIIELHDEAYNSWQKLSRDNNEKAAIARCNKLIERLDTKERLELYIKFYKCDHTEGKEDHDYIWFSSRIFLNTVLSNI